MGHIEEAQKGVGRTADIPLAQATLHALLAVVERLDALLAQGQGAPKEPT